MFVNHPANQKYNNSQSNNTGNNQNNDVQTYRQRSNETTAQTPQSICCGVFESRQYFACPLCLFR